MTNPEEGNRRQRKALLDIEIKTCRRCEGMNRPRETESAPGWGNLDSPVAIVGQSLCEQCMEPQEPFYEGSGSLLNRSFARVPMKRDRLFITNAVHCHPPKNRESYTHEIANCSSYLYRELEIVRPSLVIGLGDDASRVLSFIYPTARTVPWPFVAPRNVRSKLVPRLFFAKHPSWIMRQHNPALEEEWVDSVSAALKWAIARGSLRQRAWVEPTCKGMVWEGVAIEGGP
ncbi:uracil-DNA glycosylase [Mycobacterium kubicae]|uniref:uracil-DNA glycosylase family protein n=1 Tax=Mycobacterium kubicae TaxID=120959 RepID=UPI0007FB94B7|nr:uracil-DNA glycosylase family protein [Mycobacterium kubicae]OBF14828.1 uracil-DNA glycosylase [Mycobacterium kubicae]